MANLLIVQRHEREINSCILLDIKNDITSIPFLNTVHSAIENKYVFICFCKNNAIMISEIPKFIINGLGNALIIFKLRFYFKDNNHLKEIFFILFS